MSGKRKKDYVAVFTSILELLTPSGDPRVKELMMDFEAAMWQLYFFKCENFKSFNNSSFHYFQTYKPYCPLTNNLVHLYILCCFTTSHFSPHIFLNKLR
jgi:hypothetical protein